MGVRAEVRANVLPLANVRAEMLLFFFLWEKNIAM